MGDDRLLEPAPVGCVVCVASRPSIVEVMGRYSTAAALLILVGTPALADAQTWNDARTRALVAQATERRARQLADTGLIDYTATAHGYLTFLGQLGEGFPDPPKVVKADEIALEVYWRAPSYSKQWIVGRRDTLVLPTDIQYHRDHLGVVQNNFPNIIRLGEGDEVRDVPHPLSAPGMAAYDFAITDSLRLGIPGRTIDVYEVKLRPRDPSVAAAVGAVFLARDDAQVVRMAFSFTRAALIDKELEDVSIVLDNALIEGRFWLPRRQEIEIRRTGTWLDFPARGIIRGRWEICCYRVNVGQPVSFFSGPEIVLAPAERMAQHRWEGAILDSLPPEVRAARDQDVARVQEEARALVRERALARARQTSLSARSLSDAVRVNRAEGLSLGAGIRRRLGRGMDVSLSGRFGVSDHEAKGGLSLGWQSGRGNGIRVRLFREYRDAGDEAEASGIRNSIAAQEFGSDWTDLFDVRGGELVFDARDGRGGIWQAKASYEWTDAVGVAARPTFGVYEPTIPAAQGQGPRFDVSYDRRGLWPGGVEARVRVQSGAGRLTGTNGDRTTFGRSYGILQLERPIDRYRLVLRVAGGAAASDGDLPVQEAVFAGGPMTAPGYRFHSLAGQRLASIRAEWQTPIPFVSIPLGRWGRIPGRASIVPLGNLVNIGETLPSRSIPAGWYPSFGLGLVTLYDLLRFDVARGLRGGRWSFSVDISRDFWRIM